MRRMTNDFKALIMNMDEFVIVICLRWKSPSSTFIRLCKHFILITSRVDVVLSVDLTWLYLERYDQVAHGACILETIWAKYSSLEDWRNLNKF